MNSALQTFVEDADRALGTAADDPSGADVAETWRALAQRGADAVGAANGDASPLARAEAHLLVSACLAVAAEKAPAEAPTDASAALQHLADAEALVAQAPPAARVHVLPRVAALTAPWTRLAGSDTAPSMERIAQATAAALTEQQELHDAGIRDLTVARSLLKLAASSAPERVEQTHAAAASEATAALQAFAAAGELHLVAQARATLNSAAGSPEDHGDGGPRRT